MDPLGVWLLTEASKHSRATPAHIGIGGTPMPKHAEGFSDFWHPRGDWRSKVVVKLVGPVVWSAVFPRLEAGSVVIGRDPSKGLRR